VHPAVIPYVKDTFYKYDSANPDAGLTLAKEEEFSTFGATGGLTVSYYAITFDEDTTIYVKIGDTVY